MSTYKNKTLWNYHSFSADDTQQVVVCNKCAAEYDLHTHSDCYGSMTAHHADSDIPCEYCKDKK